MNGNQACAAYCEHLHAEHRELHHRWRALQAELNNIDAKFVDPSLRERMASIGDKLLGDLTRHFNEEEAGGCLEYAASRVPGLAAEVQSLEHEHPLLLEQVGKFIAELRAAPPGTMEVAGVKQRFDAFVVKLLAHEARENRVMEHGLNVSLGE